jgi:hypothetical protein
MRLLGLSKPANAGGLIPGTLSKTAVNPDHTLDSAVKKICRRDSFGPDFPDLV